LVAAFARADLMVCLNNRNSCGAPIAFDLPLNEETQRHLKFLAMKVCGPPLDEETGHSNLACRALVFQIKSPSEVLDS
jgi:hypothetical protein